MLILSLKKELHIKRDTICQDDVKKRLTSAEHNIIFKTKCSGTKETSPILQKYARAVLPSCLLPTDPTESNAHWLYKEQSSPGLL